MIFPLRGLPDVNPHDLEVDDGIWQIRGAIATTLTPPRTQYGATPGKPEQRKPPKYAGFATFCNPQQRMTDHSYEQESGSSPLVGTSLFVAVSSRSLP